MVVEDTVAGHTAGVVAVADEASSLVGSSDVLPCAVDEAVEHTLRRNGHSIFAEVLRLVGDEVEWDGLRQNVRSPLIEGLPLSIGFENLLETAFAVVDALALLTF